MRTTKRTRWLLWIALAPSAPLVASLAGDLILQLFKAMIKWQN